jgi:hypothetical protein
MSRFRTANQVVSSIDGGLTPFNTMVNPFPNGLQKPTNSSLGGLTDIGGILQGYTRNMRAGYSQEWNVTLQYEPKKNWLVETAYLGQFEIHQVGTSLLQEYWIPAEELEEFNRHIVGSIEVIAEYDSTSDLIADAEADGRS